MANIKARRNKEGKIISYCLRVYNGVDMSTGKQRMSYGTFEVPKGMSEEKGRKEAEKEAILFEKQCKEGLVGDNKQIFETYAETVLKLKERNGAKRRTIAIYLEFLERINPVIGHIKLVDLKPQHLNNLYGKLSEDGLNKRTGGKLSANTIRKHHTLIHNIMKHAFKEMLVPLNVAERATPPKAEKKEAKFLEKEDLLRIREWVATEPIKWKVATYLLMSTGCRRGELMGLKWSKIDFNNNQIIIDNNLLYSSSIGIYENTPKTENSKRIVKIPVEVILLLKEYKEFLREQRGVYGSKWQDNDYVFVGEDGRIMHPDSITRWLSKFAKKHNLPPISPHTFRHSLASFLIFEGVDTVTVSNSLGHARTSTTTDIYAHVTKQANEKVLECVESTLFS